MDKKSFIRGFGMGVLFATVILGISCLIRTSDAAVIKRAKKIGMEYAGQEESLFDRADTASGSVTSEKKESRPSEAAATEKPKKVKATQKPSKVLSEQKANEEELEREKEQARTEYENLTREFTITAGEWSGEVSRKLEDLEIISDAAAFDDYLEKNGYSDNIKAGTFRISTDATFEEIAKEITK